MSLALAASAYVVPGIHFGSLASLLFAAIVVGLVNAFVRPVLVVLGGRYKGGDFGDLAPALRARGRRVLAVGEARERVRAALEGVVPVEPCVSLREALERARAAARPGDVVLLAPACSSFDMFRDYVDRGRAFKAEVRRLAEDAAAGADAAAGGPRG